MDETGWRTAGQRRALWGMFDQRHAYLHVAPDRHEDHAKSCSPTPTAIVTSDRWWAYAHLPLARRQLCWSHLQRDFKAHAEGIGRREGVRRARPAALRARVLGLGGLPAHPRPPRAQAHDPPAAARVQADPAPLRRQSERATSTAAASPATCSKAWPALWTFAKHAGVEPTNNHAERALRGAVIYRKLSPRQPIRSDGERRIERLLSATPPAAYNTARCSPTSPTPSPPTPAATPCPYSPEHPDALNAYKKVLLCKAFPRRRPESNRCRRLCSAPGRAVLRLPMRFSETSGALRCPQKTLEWGAFGEPLARLPRRAAISKIYIDYVLPLRASVMSARTARRSSTTAA